MIITKYSTFFDSDRILENVQAAKNWLRKQAIEKEKKKNPKLNITPADIDNPEAFKAANPKVDLKIIAKLKQESDNDPTYLKIKELVRNNSNLTYAFVRFHMELGVPITELEYLYNRLLDVKKSGISWIVKDEQGLDTPMNFDYYANVVTSRDDQRNGFERLSDDVTKLEIERSVDRFIRNLPGDFTVKNANAPDFGAFVPSFREAARNASKKQKEEIREIAIAFDDIGDDLKEREKLHKLFYVSCYRYRSLKELIQAAREHLDSCDNRSVVDLLLQIDNVNNLYGYANGAEVVYNADNIVIFEVKSYHANKILNASTKHCIKDNYSHWQDYVSGESNFNKQYYIWNFNKNSSSKEFIIGVTVKPGSKIRAAHYKDDETVSDIKKYFLNKLGLRFDAICLPMTKEEVSQKKRRDIANKRIILPGLSFEELKSLIEDGADPNIKEGAPLMNAVKSNSLESIDFLLKKGARVNINNPMRYASSDAVILRLLKAGAEAINVDFSTYETLKLFLENGLNPNTNNGKPLLRAISLNNIEAAKLLLEYGAEIHIKSYTLLNLAIYSGRWEIVRLFVDHMLAKNQRIASADLKMIIKTLTDTLAKEKRPSAATKAMFKYFKDSLTSLRA